MDLLACLLETKQQTSNLNIQNAVMEFTDITISMVGTLNYQNVMMTWTGIAIKLKEKQTQWKTNMFDICCSKLTQWKSVQLPQPVIVIGPAYPTGIDMLLAIEIARSCAIHCRSHHLKADQ